MQIEHQAGKYATISCDLLAYPIFEEEAVDFPQLQVLNEETDGVFQDVLSSGEFKPELHNACRIHKPRGLKAERLLLLGAGKKSQFTLSRLREVAGTAVRNARTAGCRRVAFVPRGEYSPAQTAQVVTEGGLYANYEPDVYKTRDKEGREVDQLVLVAEMAEPAKINSGIRRGVIVGHATNLARILGNEPANILTPSQFAARALQAAQNSALQVEVLEREQMEKLGMNTLLAVSRGSDEPPKLIILRVKGRATGTTYAIVGKGVTFDSGGLSIKPAEKMEDMKADMAGGAAVLAAMTALAQLGPAQDVIGLIPAVENLPGGRATKPGDVVKSYLGKTVEIINTDAEGRLILADSLAYARTLGADHLVDIATLTGACVIALGSVNAGMMGTDEQMIERLRKNISFTGERLWQLPLDEDYRKLIRSEIADFKNVGNRWGGAITAAKFLQEFVEETPWVHLDIAGVDLDHDGRPFAAKGATGFGVRTLVELLS